MTVTRKIATIPLAAMLIFGFTGCSTFANTGTGSGISNPIAGSSPKVQQDLQKEVSTSILKTVQLNHDPEVSAFLEELSSIQQAPSISEAKTLFAKHQSAVNKARQLVETNEKASAKYVDEIKRTGNDREFFAELEKPENKELRDSILALTIVSYFGTEEGADAERAGVVESGFKTRTDGGITVLDTSAYLEDENGGILTFISSAGSNMAFSKDGKKVSTSMLVQTEVPAGENELSIEIASLADTVESWLSEQPGDDVPLKAYESQILDKAELSGNNEFVIDGSSRNYTITGINKANGQALTYNNMEKVIIEKTRSKNSASLDYLLHSSYFSLLEQTQNASKKVITIDEFVSKLNENKSSDNETYEVVNKNGKDYVKVGHTESNIASKGDLLYAFPASE